PWGLSARSQSARRLPQLRIGTATITAITTITVAAVEPGTAAGLAGPSRAAFMARGTSMEAARATTDINSAEAALSGGLFFFAGSAGSSHLRREFFAHGQVGWRGTAQALYVSSNSTDNFPVLKVDCVRQ